MPWIHALVDVPPDLHGAATRFWGGVLGWPAGGPFPGQPEFRSFDPPDGTAYVHLQQVDDSPRVHLDIETDDLDAAALRAVELGAELIVAFDDYRTLRSPGGLLWCVVPAAEHEPPGPVTWPGGHRSRMVQVCIDSPAAVHEREVTFWRALLGGSWVDSDGPEFAGRWLDDAGAPLQLLFQRLDEPHGAVRVHLDHGTDDRPAEVARLLDLGAEDVAEGRGWHVLRDPAGLLFCVTDNSPSSPRTPDLR